MTKQQNLSELSLEQLHKRAKTAKTVSGLLAGLVFLQFAVGIYLTTQQGFNVFTIIPLAFLPILIVNFSTIKTIKEEIAKRK